MKKNIHPNYYGNAVVTCACGNTFTTGSTKQEIKVEICSKCHPFFTGEVKFVDSLGRVERFRQKQTQSAGKVYLKKKERKLAKIAEAEAKEKATPKSLKEMLTSK